MLIKISDGLDPAPAVVQPNVNVIVRLHAIGSATCVRFSYGGMLIFPTKYPKIVEICASHVSV
jgi:hypothetical protein